MKNTETGSVYISSQNHGYAVVSESIDHEIAKELFVNVNDQTNEGLRYKKMPAFPCSSIRKHAADRKIRTFCLMNL